MPDSHAHTTDNTVRDKDAVRAELTFITPSATKPRFNSAALTGGAPQLFFQTERHSVPIADMRPRAASLSLDHEGFALRRHQSAVTDFHSDAAIQTRYYAEVEAIVAQATGASRVVVFDVTRRSDASRGAPNPDGLRGPADRVHVDYTETSGPRRAADILGATELARLLAAGARVLQVNVWRPMRGPVLRSPLTLADASSIRREHLVATDQMFPDRIGEIYHLVHSPDQRWYYAPHMTTSEVLLIKGWDSLDDGRARFTPHTAFALPVTLPDAPPRESIEVRTFAVIGQAQGSRQTR